MAKTKYDRSDPRQKILLRLSKMKYTDLKAAALVRGMDFTDIVRGDFGRLESWLIKNWHNKQDKTLLEEFDIWMDEQLKKNGHENDDPVRKFRLFSSMDEEKEVKVKKRLKRAQIHVEKKKRTRNEFGLFTGTKKDYTYHLTKDLYSKFKDKYTCKEIYTKFTPQLIFRVKKKYPDAVDKSLKIWFKRALDAICNKTG